MIDRATARLRELEPEAIAVLVGGSYAQETADELSDLDLTALVERAGGRYRTWFEERSGARPLHVSAGVRSVEDWLARRHKPAGWWLGLPVYEPARYAWATEAVRERLGEDPSLVRPPGPPELEDFFEFSVKAKRAAGERDVFGLRVWALAAAELAPRLLVPLNDVPPVSSRREAAETALAFTMAPEHWAQDLATCLGLIASDDAAVAQAAPRLALQLLAFLREHKPDVDPLPDLVECLTSGAFERQLSS